MSLYSRSFLPFLAVLGALAAPAGLLANKSASTGFDFSTGTYGGSTRTDSISIPLGFSFSRGAFNGSISTAYLRITGDGSYVPGVGSVAKLLALRPRTGLLARRFATVTSGSAATAATTPTVTTEQGLGDLTLQNSFQLPSFGAGAPIFSLGLETKLGLADADKGLGSGENDYAPKIAVHKDWETWGLGFDSGYRFFGDPDGVDLKNGFFGSVSAWLTLNSTSNLSISLSAAQASSAGESTSATAGLGYSHTVTDRFSVTYSLSKGLTTASADYSTGFSLGFSF